MRGIFLAPAPSVSCEPGIRPPDARQSRAGIAEAVAGFVADVGMHEPSPQETFADQARLLHHARRADIVHVTKSADPENGRLAHGPIHDFGENFCHEALPPPGSRREVAEVETVWGGLAQGEDSPQPSVVPIDKDISSGDIRWCSNALRDVGFGVAAARGAAARSRSV